MLCEFALTKDHCKLVEMDLGYCSLTDDCIPDLGKTQYCNMNIAGLGFYTYIEICSLRKEKSPFMK